VDGLAALLELAHHLGMGNGAAEQIALALRATTTWGRGQKSPERPSSPA